MIIKHGDGQILNILKVKDEEIDPEKLAELLEDVSEDEEVENKKEAPKDKTI